MTLQELMAGSVQIFFDGLVEDAREARTKGKSPEALTRPAHPPEPRANESEAG